MQSLEGEYRLEPIARARWSRYGECGSLVGGQLTGGACFGEPGELIGRVADLAVEHIGVAGCGCRGDASTGCVNIDGSDVAACDGKHGDRISGFEVPRSDRPVYAAAEQQLARQVRMPPRSRIRDARRGCAAGDRRRGRAGGCRCRLPRQLACPLYRPQDRTPHFHPSWLAHAGLWTPDSPPTRGPARPRPQRVPYLLEADTPRRRQGPPAPTPSGPALCGFR